MNKSKISGLALVSFLFAVAGVVISTMTIKEDVISTAKTIFEYFPSRYGVTPSTTWVGALTLGVFTSVFQVVAASVAFSKNFYITNRVVAFFALGISLTFDNWTDVVFRSGYLSGDVAIAWVTTIAFYTLGSEIMQGLSWLVVFSSWRVAISDFMWGVAKFKSGLSSIGSEWHNFERAARNKDNSSSSVQNQERFQGNQGDRGNQPRVQPHFTVNQQGKSKSKDGISNFPFYRGDDKTKPRN